MVSSSSSKIIRENFTTHNQRKFYPSKISSYMVPFPYIHLTRKLIQNRIIAIKSYVMLIHKKQLVRLLQAIPKWSVVLRSEGAKFFCR